MFWKKGPRGTPAPGPAVGVEHGATVVAAPGGEVVLYDRQRRPLRVAAGLVDELIRDHGFTRVPADLNADLAELEARWGPTLDAIRRAVRGVTETGQVDPHPDAAWHTAAVAFDQVGAAFHKLYRDGEALYPIAEGRNPEVRIQNPEGG
jgi:hypothetical protein